MISSRIAIMLLCVLVLFPACLYRNTAHRRAEGISSSLGQRKDDNPLHLLLGHLRLAEEDLVIEVPEKHRDHYCIHKTQVFLSNPFLIAAYSEDISHRLENCPPALAPLLTLAVDELEIDLNGASSADMDPIPPLERRAMLSGIQAEARAAIVELISAIVACRYQTNEAFASLSQKDMLYLGNYFSEMLLKDKMRPATVGAGRSGSLPRTPLKSHQHYAKEMSFILPAGIRSAELYQAALSLAHAVDRLLENSDRLVSINGSGTPMESGELKGDIVAREDTPWGCVIIGGKGASCYSNINPLLIIDLGGDDEYHNVYSSPAFSPFNASTSVIIDLAGNDIYRSTKLYTQGSAAFGCSFLVDCGGDDTYLAADFSQGCGFFGLGVLDDRKGNDRYRADTMAQGAAAFGIGILADREGNDSYHGSLYNQGSAFTGGLGLLIDVQGDDAFFAGGTYPDYREPEGAFVSFSQGCGFGDRNYASGGLGILWNGSGHDRYRGSYFAQGSGYWLGTGLLIDRAGSDSYRARRYAQGSSTHKAVGALLDRAGNDVYESWGATQGCGYDSSQGLLFDSGGDDLYNATWFAQGSGGKAGTGILVDRSGNDSYRSGSFYSQGNGQYWDEEKTGSIGLAIDLGGTDAYSGAGKNNYCWRQGYYGGGIDTAARLDLPVWKAMSTPRPPVEISDPGTLQLFEHSEPLPELEIDLNDEESRQSAVEQLAARGPAVIPRLLAYTRMNDVQLSFTVREIIAKLGTDAAPALQDALDEYAEDPRVIAFILSSLGDLRDDSLLERFLSFLPSDEGIVRIASMRGISRLAHGLPAETILPAAADETPAVRKFCAVALGSSNETAAIKTLVTMLADGHYAVRFAAFESLRNRVEEAGPYLRELVSGNGNHPDYARALAGDLLEEAGNGGSEASTMVRGRP